MKKNLLCLTLLIWSLSADAQSAYRIIYETNDKYLNNVLQPEDSAAYVYSSTNSNDFDYVRTVWNIPSQNYVSDIKYVYSYNQQGSLVETAYYKWDGTSWIPQSKGTYTYNAQNIMTQYSSFSWTSNNWIESFRSTYINNVQGKKIEQLEQNASGGQLENYRKYKYVYDNSQRLIKDSAYYWNTVNSTWRFGEMMEYFYGIGSTLVDSSRRYSVIPPNNNIELLYKTYYKYNTQGKEIERLEFYDYMGTYTPLPYRHYTNLYDSKGNVIESGYKEITNGQWVDQRRTLSQYNTQNQLMERTFLQFKSSLGYVANNSRAVYAYAQDSSLIVIDGFSWVDDNWLPSGQTRIGYEPLQQQTNIQDNNVSKTIAYPNPFTQNTILEFEAAESGVIQLQITDLNGRTVLHKNVFAISGKNSFLWEATDNTGNPLPAGLYIANIKSPAGIQSIKLIKQQ